MKHRPPFPRTAPHPTLSPAAGEREYYQNTIFPLPRRGGEGRVRGRRSSERLLLTLLFVICLSNLHATCAHAQQHESTNAHGQSSAHIDESDDIDRMIDEATIQPQKPVESHAERHPSHASEEEWQNQHPPATEVLVLLRFPFLACLVLTGIHCYLGIHVIARGVIFVDLALAQMAALGGVIALLVGLDPHGTVAYLMSLVTTLLG